MQRHTETERMQNESEHRKNKVVAWSRETEEGREKKCAEKANKSR